MVRLVLYHLYVRLDLLDLLGLLDRLFLLVLYHLYVRLDLLVRLVRLVRLVLYHLYVRLVL